MKGLDDIIQETVSQLKLGNTILYPTDTIWGIGCNATREDSVKNIFSLKKRKDSTSLVVLVSGDAMLNRVIPNVPEVAWDLFDNATTPLTLVLPNASWVAKSACAEDGSVAVRMIKNGPLHKIIHLFGRPIISTSANISGEPFPPSFNAISKEITSSVDYLVDMPDTGSKKPSSVLKIGLKGEVKILRA